MSKDFKIHSRDRLYNKTIDSRKQNPVLYKFGKAENRFKLNKDQLNSPSPGKYSPKVGGIGLS